MKIRPLVLFTILLPIALIAAAKFPHDTLTDADLVAYAKPFHGSHDWKSFPTSGTMVGVHHDTKVVAEVRCSDLCPAYTRMVIHYDLVPGAECRAVDGAEVDILMPISIAVRSEKFCVPRILLNGRLYSAP